MGTAARIAAAERRDRCAGGNSRCMFEVEAHVHCRCTLLVWKGWLNGVADKRLAVVLGRRILGALIVLLMRRPVPPAAPPEVKFCSPSAPHPAMCRSLAIQAAGAKLG